MDFLCKIRDVFRLAEGHAQLLQLRHPRRQQALGVHGAQGVPHPLPDGGLCFHRNLLPDDVMHDRRKQVGIHLALDRPDLRDGRR